MRTIYWEEERALILSDLHLGKTGHFRKSGIAVPQQVYRDDLQRLIELMQWHQPERLIIVGDMIHSRENRELDWFTKWRMDFAHLEIHLIKGNHDILETSWYRERDITFHSEFLDLGPFRFIHEKPNDNVAGTLEDKYVFSGHLHPGVILSGAGKQRLRFPCFFFGKQQCILPAFSAFTGLAALNPGPDDLLYAIVENALLPLP